MKFLLTACLLLAFLLCPAACADGVRDGLSLAAGAALPALFPFFVASGLLVRTGAAAPLCRALARPLRALYGLPAAAAPAVVLGLIGGYPVGARATADLLSRREITKEEGERLVSFCNCASPAFCISLCGLALFGSAKTGAILYGIHALAALLAGLLTARGKPCRLRGEPAAKPATEPFARAFCGAVQDAAQTALTVTAFLTIFCVLLRLLAPALAVLPQAGALSGLLELTCGLDRLQDMVLPTSFLLPLVSFLLGFGGLSVHFQAHTLLAPHELCLRRFTLGKLLHGGIAAALTAALLRASPAAMTVFAPAAAPSSPAQDWTGAIVLILLIVFPFWAGKKRKGEV